MAGIPSARKIIDSLLGESPGDEDQEQLATAEFGRHCGLNADWSVMAWHLSPGPANKTSGDFYFLDNEDGTWSIVKRTYVDGGNDEIHEMYVSKDFDTIFKKAKKIRGESRGA